MNIVVIDDERTFKSDEDITYLRTSDQGLLYLVKHMINGYGPVIDQLWLDHDLGGSDTIMPVVDFLQEIGIVSCGMRIREIFVHTQNAPAGDSIVKCLYKFYHTTRMALPELV